MAIFITLSVLGEYVNFHKCLFSHFGQFVVYVTLSGLVYTKFGLICVLATCVCCTIRSLVVSLSVRQFRG